ncbi:MAG: exonuclease domain-containing protein [Gammaproteobacteria bacterium]|jgi:DNA polymerase III subunit epsilon
MFGRFVSADKRRLRLLEKAPEGPVRDYLAHPFPDEKQGIFETRIVSMDFETTGLDTQKDDILSIGYVELQHNAIRLHSATHIYLEAQQAIPEASAVIHRITDDMAADVGKPLSSIMTEMLDYLKGKVILAHHADIERTFLQKACNELWGFAPVFPMIDTLELARQWFDRRNMHFSPHELRLFNLRDRYGLPRYPAHNALTDALSTAELFLAQLDYIGDAHKLRLKQFLVKGK